MAAATALTMLVAPVAAFAQDEDVSARLARLEALVASQQARIEAQEALLAQRAAPATQAATPGILDAWRVQPEAVLASETGRGLAQEEGSTPSVVAATPAAGASLAASADDTPQAQAAPPALSRQRAELAAIPEGMTVLSRPGRFSFDLSTDYTRSSSNRLVFRGIEIVPGIQIGVIEANEADRDTIGATVAGRFGLTDRLEVEARVPYVRRSDIITTVQQRDEAVTRTIDLKGDGVGDVEAAVRYQINRGERGRPIFVGTLRVKSDTGEGPFDIDRDEFGVATRLATGSGFWGVEPSVSMLFPSDPAVIFANLSYFAHLPKDVNMQEGDILVGEVDPGDSIGAAIGFGFAMNQNFSYSLGYRHNYILSTTSQLNNITEESDELQVGTLQFGMSYRFNDRFSLNGNFEFGVTEDAPDMRFVLRVPLVF
ncbi:porin family protein [Brevundimonas sp. PAMC22021]|uniref:porin family protein n=1 Tax=Brevundimonas sp. PAMC22021 TaxID=2861285 RepID=UPI0021077BEF|nr:porin family protein [Brevundimonas sp. PAMC22021]